jgi:hypothetical protein
MTIAIGQYTIRRASGHKPWTLWWKVDGRRMIYVSQHRTQGEAEAEKRRLEAGEL